MNNERVIEILKMIYEAYEAPLALNSRADTRAAINSYLEALDIAMKAVNKQTPNKVEWAIDYTWGTARKQPVCPVCDYYLTMTEFIGDGEKITYCDHCGSSIDWSGEDD